MTSNTSLAQAIREKEKAKEKFIAFEFYPPKTEKGVENLYARFERMIHQKPLYADITWGAGGSTSDLTLDIAKKLQEVGFSANMHLTCTNMPVEKITTALEGAKNANIRNIVALRGDPPQGQERWEATEGGFSCALDLVKHIRKEYNDFFTISVAGYPEGHPTVIKEVANTSSLSEKERSRVVELNGKTYVCSDEDYKKELLYLKQKCDAGADFIITQMIFDIPLFFEFVKDCRAIGIQVPIIPGLMLIQNYGGFRRMTEFCKSRVPQKIMDRMNLVREDENAVKEAGIAIGTEMCEELFAGGSYGLHLYCLNLEKVTLGILKNLGLYNEVPTPASTPVVPPVPAESHSVSGEAASSAQ